MILKERFDEFRAMVLVNKLNYALNNGAKNIELEYNTDTKSFSVGFWVEHERSKKDD